MRKVKPKTMDKLSDTPSSSDRPIYPTFRLDLEQFPEAKKWEVGEEYEITMKVKMVGMSQSRYQNDAEFEVREIEGSESEEDNDEEDE